MQYLRKILNQIDRVRDKKALSLLKKWYDPKVSDSDYVIAMKKLRKEFDE